MIYDYDFIIIDCSPSLNMTTINALVASDFTIYVTQLEYFSMQGLEQLQKTVDMVKEINSELKDLGLILTMADGTNHVKDVLDELKDSSYKLLGTIDRATLVRDSIMAKQAVFQYEKNHKVANQYQEFVDTLLQLTGTNTMVRKTAKQIREEEKQALELLTQKKQIHSKKQEKALFENIENIKKRKTLAYQK